MAEFFLHRGHRLVTDATRNEQIEVAEVGVHVQRESVRRNAARNVHADGGDLACRFPPCPCKRGKGKGGALWLSAPGTVHAPVRPATRPVGIRKSAQVRISTSSSWRTYPTAPNVFRCPPSAGNPRRSKIG